MAEAAISSLVQLLGDVLIQKVKFLKGVEGKVRVLRDELESMQAFLTDANKRQYEEAGVRIWISQLRELAHDAEDTIEMFVINVENARSDGVLQRCISFPKCVIDLITIGEEIDSISERLEAIKRRRDTYQIKDLAEAAPSALSSNVEWRRRQVDDDPVGLEDDVQKLLRWLSLNREKGGLEIAVVEGMGGIGKSTLARKIYSHSAVVGGGFDCRAWVVVSSEFKPQETMKQLILELGGSYSQELRELEKSAAEDKLYLQQKLQEMVNEQLQGKTYFIVLDDVWEVEHWEFIKNAFPDQQDKKCRMLITTRNHDMTKCGPHVHVHKMMVLNPEKSWELLLKKAFVDGHCSQELESIGRQILEKCNGLPLTIGVVGGLLVGKQSRSEWEQVLSQINSCLESVDSNLSVILELSYQNLSPHLKSCFLGLAFFKEDATIFTKRLVNIWVGQGLIRQDGRRTAEEIGRSYLDELINRNMVHIKELTFDERVKTCQLHDLIRDVCLTKAKEEIGFAMVNTISTSTESSSSKLRNCVVNEENLMSSLKHNRKLRSLFLDIHELRSDEFRDLMKNSPLLKILDVDVDIDIDIDVDEEFRDHEMRKLPRCLAKLIGLKYLRIDNSIVSRSSYKMIIRDMAWEIVLRDLPMGVQYIPRWVDRMKKLEVIDIPFSILQFPNVRLNMESLRYLRGIVVEGMVGIESWKNIETLGYVRVGDWIRYITKLKSTYPLRELSILLNKYESDREFIMFRESIEKMENLITLRLRLNKYLVYDSTLFIPCHGSRLTKLKIENLTTCPSADKFPPNLSHLTLKWSGLCDDTMENLGKLPNLSYLNLKDDSYERSRMKVLHDGFPRLKVLTLKYLGRLEDIEIEEGGMPLLKHLRIRSCWRLKTHNLPKHFIISTT